MIKITALKTENMVNPIGITTVKPKVSWKIESDKNNTLITAYQIKLAKKGEKEGSFYDSGKVASDKVFAYIARPVFSSCTEFYWKVTVWDNYDNSADSEYAFFEMGKLKAADWSARWIEPEQLPLKPTSGYMGDVLTLNSEPFDIPEAELAPSPILRREFKLEKKVAKARLYATAHGIYLMYLNGKRVGDLEFMPECTPYKKMLQVQTYDITDMLIEGDNVIAAELGTGWWAGHITYYANACVYGTKTALLCQADITFEDGTKLSVGSDGEFKSYFGETVYSDIGIGEKTDRRRYVDGWNEVGEPPKQWGSFGKPWGEWRAVTVCDYGYDNLVGQNAEPIRVVKTITPVSRKDYADGTVLFDFGEILSGNVELVFDGEGRRGEEITVSYCEQTDKNGDFVYNFAGYRRHEDIFILRGEKQESYCPKFFYCGYRWVRVKGYSGIIANESVTARLIASDVEKTSYLKCSNEKLTLFHEAIQRTFIDNFMSIPTDNPDRERAGWTGDLEMTVATMLCNYDLSAFLKRYMAEHRCEQREDGGLPLVIPGDMKFDIGNCAGWQDDVVIVPWEIYLANGDLSILADNYEMMRRWIEYVRERCLYELGENPQNPFMPCCTDMKQFKNFAPDMSEEHRENFRYIWDADYQFGDWLTPSGKGYTDITQAGYHNNIAFMPNYYTTYTTGLMVKIAELLGKKEDSAYYTALNARYRKAVLEELYDTGFIPESKFQGVLVCALKAGLYRDGERERLEKRLAEVITELDNGKINTGFTSGEHIMEILTSAGRADLAYDLLLSEEPPSYIYMINNGATGVWESWNVIQDGEFTQRASFVQYGIGAVGKWMMTKMAGISPALPGYRKIRFEPVIDPKERITSAEAQLNTPYGIAEIQWKKEGSGVKLKITVPAGAEAEIVFHGSDKPDLLVGSGEYSFEYALK